MKPIVALVGRPNVGKSTLFNRMTRQKNALVDNFPGVTRDRHYGEAEWLDKPFMLIDTGGFLTTDEDPFARDIREQVQQAVESADIIVVVLDGREGVSPFDMDLVDMLRSVQKPVFYAVNKIDQPEIEKNIYDFYSLGVARLYPVSSEHGYGFSAFMDDLIREMPETDETQAAEMIKLAVVGRPNVGKSSLINRLLGKKRLLVSDVPGTTRDAIDSICTVNGESFLLVDTAGIRRKGKVSRKIEKFSVIKSLRSLDRCDVALILLDADEGITEQDITIAGYAYERGCGCIFLLNKWDLVEKDADVARRYYDRLRYEAKYLSFAPAMTISALTGLRVTRVFSLVKDVYQQYTCRIGTGTLNRIIEQAVEQNDPPFHKGKRLKFYYISQVSAKPPTFVCFVNYPEVVHFSYRRYLMNQIREKAGLDKTPLRLIFRLRTGKIEFGASSSRPHRLNKDSRRKNKRFKKR